MNADKLRGVMAEKRCTQIALAHAIGITPTSLGNKMNGKTVFNTAEAQKICEYLGIDDPRDRAIIFLTQPS